MLILALREARDGDGLAEIFGATIGGARRVLRILTPGKWARHISSLAGLGKHASARYGAPIRLRPPA